MDSDKPVKPRGPVSRVYPPPGIRKSLIDEVRRIPVSKRTAAQSYQLGSLLVYEGCLNDSTTLLQEAETALRQAAAEPNPLPDAVLDLSWLCQLTGRNEEGLEFARQATDLSQT